MTDIEKLEIQVPIPRRMVTDESFENVTTSDDLARNETRWIMSIESVIHRTPPPSQGITPCCERTPFELPVWDRMTSDPAAVTCQPEETP